MAVSVELVCAQLAYETLGEVDRGIYWMVIALNLPLLVLALWRMPAAGVGVLILALIIVPYQVVLADRLWRVQNEAAQIVHYVQQERLANGSYPADLSGYVYRDPDMARYIQAYQLSAERGGFLLTYRVGTVNTSHSYSPRHGWQYYPD
jgi:hypothetical protein